MFQVCFLNKNLVVHVFILCFKSRIVFGRGSNHQPFTCPPLKQRTVLYDEKRARGPKLCLRARPRAVQSSALRGRIVTDGYGWRGSGWGSGVNRKVINKFRLLTVLIYAMPPSKRQKPRVPYAYAAAIVTGCRYHMIRTAASDSRLPRRPRPRTVPCPVPPPVDDRRRAACPKWECVSLTTLLINTVLATALCRRRRRRSSHHAPLKSNRPPSPTITHAVVADTAHVTL